MFNALISKVCAFLAAVLFGAMGISPTPASGRGLARSDAAPLADVGQHARAVAGKTLSFGDGESVSCDVTDIPPIVDVPSRMGVGQAHSPRAWALVASDRLTREAVHRSTGLTDRHSLGALRALEHWMTLKIQP